LGSKYDKLNLPKLMEEDSTYQEKVNTMRAAIASDRDFQLHASTLARLYIETRTGLAPETISDLEREALVKVLGKEGIEELASMCNLRMTAIEQMLAEQYEVEGTTSVKLETGESVSVQIEPYAQVQDREVFRKWCIEQGFESLMTIPWMTASKLTKDRLLDGEPEPPGVKAYARNKFVLRRG
jgi:hypothetical protein